MSESAALATELEVLKDVAARLDAARFNYMLTGSMAMSFHATPRMTRDIDLVVQIEPGRIADLAAAFSPDYYVPAHLPQLVGEQGMFNLLHLESMVKVDLVMRKSEPFRLHEFSRRCRVDLGGFDLWLVTREDLVLSKLVWARASDSELQLRDVRNLLDGEVDLAYLREWAKNLGVDALLEACVQ